MKTRLFIPLFCACIATPILSAEVEAENYIKYREGLMENARNHTKAIGSILKGGVDAKAHLVRHARALREISLMIPDAFPEGSDFGETEAKANVWSDRAGFDKAIQQYQQAVEQLVKASETGDSAGIGSAMETVGKSCKGCHDEYREKNN